ncbi:MFS transporter [Kribbella sp. CA-293567]|uniref:MFS transporter n=1 Tax=Kribbella sp. CA-293567 TaxID=3002436 RepID=UPI0022DE270D|nr:MFS transporter [Kribbella sp. CA-293567]WBQ06562.1 MFS transporter [Kribbella sp. CA-293567]
MSARIYLLAAGAFAVGTSAYVVSGVLPAVSSELHVSLTAAGQLATAFALSYAVGAPLLSTLTGRWERRTLLIAALLLAAVGNGIAAIATSYPILIAGRIVAALGAAAYTPAATLFATRFLPPEERGRAVAVVFGGLTFALVLGVPAGSLLGEPLGYRGVFALIAAVCLVVTLAVRVALPTVEAPAAVSLRERFAGLTDRRVQTVLAITVLAVLATMSVYIYVVPLLAETADLKGGTVGVLLLVYGVGAVLGNLLGGRATDRFGSLRTLTVTLIGFTVVIATLTLTATTVAGAAIALFVWSVFTWAFNPPIQNLLLELGEGGGLLLAMNASAIYLGAGLSAIAGGVVIKLVGVQMLPPIAGALGLVVIGLLVTLRRNPGLQQVEQLEPVEEPLVAVAD